MTCGCLTGSDLCIPDNGCIAQTIGNVTRTLHVYVLLRSDAPRRFVVIDFPFAHPS